ncbi:unnamed protein product [Urochloa decumbens]|uniref:BTB domain-containing protein n=1 Tax=Urochloa decumbens TaxID=240449 RepID=A0ABC8WBI3_9POAL
MATAAAAALLSASARRLSRRSFGGAARRLSTTFSSASSLAVREMTGSHKFTIDGYTQSKRVIKSKGWTSPALDAAGSRWQIWYGPCGHEDAMGNQHISLYLHYLHPDHDAAAVAADVNFRFSLLDQSGNPVPEFTRATAELCSFNGDKQHGWRKGFDDFVTWSDLEESGRRRRRARRRAAAAAHVVVPPPDLREHIADVLWKQKHGTDVTVDVAGGEAVSFDAHGCVLAARSPVFKGLLAVAASNSKTKSAAGAGHRRVEIQGIDPWVLEAVLHYMYTDALPEAVTEQDDLAAVLAAACRFEIERLRLMCEEMLCRRIDTGTVADILVLAERHGCRGLRAACFEFMAAASPGNLKAVVATEGYERLRAECPSLLAEFVMMKQLAATT